MMKELHVQQAIGMPLAHDLTKIVPGEFKGRIFKKGHIIKEEDIPTLLDIGKQHIYVLDIPTGYIHENDAAERLGVLVSVAYTKQTQPEEGKVVLKANCDGLLVVDEEKVFALNLLGDLAIVTKQTHTPVRQGDSLVGLKIIPLLIEKTKLDQVEQILMETSTPIVQVRPFQTFRVGIVTTGSEVASGRIQDRFRPVLEKKIEEYGSSIHRQIIVGDSQDLIIDALEQLKSEGCDLLLCTGGMSVDPDDRTPGAIRRFATEVVTYGMPMLPGSMMLLAYHEDIPIFGLPGCVIFDPITSFDRLLPRVLSGIRVQFKDIAALGHGGYL